MVNFQKNVFVSIWSLLSDKDKGKALLYVLMSIVATLFEALSLGLIIPLLSLLIGNFSNVGKDSNFLERIIPYLSSVPIEKLILGLILIFIIKNLYIAILSTIQSRFVFGVEEDISRRIFRHYLEMPYSYFLDKNSAKLIRDVIGESSNFSHNALSPLCSLFSEGFIILGIVILLIFVNPLGVIFSALILGFLGYLFQALVRKKVSLWGVLRHKYEAARIQKLQEGFGSIKEIKIGSFQNIFSKEYDLATQGSCKAGRNQQAIQSLPRIFLEILAVTMLLGMVGISDASNRSNLVPVLGLYAAAAFRLMPSVNRILNSLQAIRFAEPAVSLLYRELNHNSSSLTDEKLKLDRKISFNKNIEFRNVSFRFNEGSKFVFTEVNFEIKKGELVCIVGSSGAGKSTLIDIVCGLLKPTSGKVLVDGVDINGSRTSWQQNISYVPQNIFLIDATVGENITFGYNPKEVTPDYVMSSALCAELGGFIDSNGLTANVGERGSKVSGGQKQRIGLARAIYRKKNLLILDEATNALDDKAEERVVKNLIKDQKGVSILWITHGSSPLKYADRILRVIDGQVVDETQKKGAR